MNLLEVLKKCEPNVSQIARDAEVTRQAVYLWKEGHIPSPETFKRLASLDKYHEALADVDHETLWSCLQVGRPRKEEAG